MSSHSTLANTMRCNAHRLLLGGALVLWGASAVGLLMAFAQLGSAGAHISHAGWRWPDGACVPRCADRIHLLMFLHPQCPCSAASIRDLERCFAGATQRYALSIVVLAPSERDSAWRNTQIVALAAGLPNARVEWDVDGRDAQRFGATTSGEVMVFNRDGMLEFSGGVCAARGHEGPNDGQAAVAQLLRGTSPTVRATPVVGCGLLSPNLLAAGDREK